METLQQFVVWGNDGSGWLGLNTKSPFAGQLDASPKTGQNLNQGFPCSLAASPQT